MRCLQTDIEFDLRQDTKASLSRCMYKCTCRRWVSGVGRFIRKRRAKRAAFMADPPYNSSCVEPDCKNSQKPEPDCKKSQTAAKCCSLARFCGLFSWLLQSGSLNISQTATTKSQTADDLQSGSAAVWLLLVAVWLSALARRFCSSYCVCT